MISRPLTLALALGALSVSPTLVAGDNPRVRTDSSGDAVVRRTDPSVRGSINAAANRPNLLKLSIGAWGTNTPVADPYAGSYIDPENADLFRLDLELKGLINPPGSVAQSSYDPFIFGPSPLYGSIELDIDRDRDTGGELGAAAKSKYLANVGRFGRAPYDSVAERAVRYGWEIDTNFTTPPQLERSGADFLLVFCGCFQTMIVSQWGNTNGIFEPGEMWIVRGGFFQRAGGYQSVCSSSGGAGGLQPGSYVPWVDLRWSHNIATDTTMVTLVYPLTMIGAGQLAGQPAQPPNLSASDQTSIVEALTDLIQGIPSATNGSPVWHLAQRWNGRDPEEVQLLDPTRWGATALVGTAYTAPLDGAVWAWTDTGFEETIRDLDGDGVSGLADKQMVIDSIRTLDGSVWDADGVTMENGSVRLISPGVNFAMTDIDGDSIIGRADVREFCPGDFNRDGLINALDYASFFDAYNLGNIRADLNTNGRLDIADFVAFMNAAATGC